MQDKDKHLIVKKLSLYNTTNACNCDYAARKSHDDLMTNIARAQQTHLNHSQMSSSPLSFQNVLAKQNNMTFNTIDNDLVESKFVPFKKRPFQSSNNLNETSKSTGDYLPSDNSFNFNNKKSKEFFKKFFLKLIKLNEDFYFSFKSIDNQFK